MAVRVGDAATQAVEERIQRRGPVVAGVAVASTGVGLPHLEQCVGDGFSVAVEYAAVNDDALSLCFAAVGNGQVVFAGADAIFAEYRPVSSVSRWGSSFSGCFGWRREVVL